jgi:hypothetical protein
MNKEEFFALFKLCFIGNKVDIVKQNELIIHDRELDLYIHVYFRHRWLFPNYCLVTAIADSAKKNGLLDKLRKYFNVKNTKYTFDFAGDINHFWYINARVTKLKV